MRRGDLFGMNNIMIAILASIILAIIAILLINLINPAAESAAGFGEQAAGVFD